MEGILGNHDQKLRWVDYIFIQSTAWFLGHDIIIVTTTSTEDHPFITISGNLMNENIPCPGIELTLGSKSQVHYQSLLPIPIKVQKNQMKARIPEDTIIKQASSNKISNATYDLDSKDDFPFLHPTKIPTNIKKTPLKPVFRKIKTLC